MATQERLIGYNELAAIYQEYVVEYITASDKAATEIWTSMQRRNGDPRWEWACNQYDSNVELCR